MKTMRKMIGAIVAVTAFACVLAVPVQARTFVSFNFGVGGYYPVYGGAYHPPCYYSCPPRAYYYARPVYRPYCAPPVDFYGRGRYYWR